MGRASGSERTAELDVLHVGGNLWGTWAPLCGFSRICLPNIPEARIFHRWMLGDGGHFLTIAAGNNL